MSITIHQCAITKHNTVLVDPVSWTPTNRSSWLITGKAKSLFGKALSGTLDFEPEKNGFYSNTYKDSTFFVSFEYAQRILEFERKNDDSDYTDGGIDIGRTPRKLISELSGHLLLDKHPLVQNFGLLSILDQGIKYLSTGEIKKTLLCSAFLKKPELLILDDPFDGLDSGSSHFLHQQLLTGKGSYTLILVMDAHKEIPPYIDTILQIDEQGITWSGTPENFKRAEQIGMSDSATGNAAITDAAFSPTFSKSRLHVSYDIQESSDTLVEFRNVTVSWSGRDVLKDITWTLKKGEHWQIRGPNGSGKTTFLELITGDNPQAYSNEVYLFGQKRGSGETLWDIRKKIGLVSWKLHSEFGYFGSMPVEHVLLSGLHDSIGLYTDTSDTEKELVKEWLSASRFPISGTDRFDSLTYGEQRAVLVLRAALKLPLILILDEPCHGVDLDQQQIILHMLETIAVQGYSTILHVTHNPEEVLTCEKWLLELIPGGNPMYRITARNP